MPAVFLILQYIPSQVIVIGCQLFLRDILSIDLNTPAGSLFDLFGIPFTQPSKHELITWKRKIQFHNRISELAVCLSNNAGCGILPQICIISIDIFSVCFF